MREGERERKRENKRERKKERNTLEISDADQISVSDWKLLVITYERLSRPTTNGCSTQLELEV